MAPVRSFIEPLVEKWLQLDPNPITRADIKTLWDSGDLEELDRRMSQHIQFGTAGLRGKMEAGWARMNDLIIIQTAQGLAEYVLQNVQHALELGLVVGYDHRHNSKHWAELTAQVFAEKGFKIYFLNGFNHTPMVPFSITEMNAACGVMITASHNPKDDNGFKVYWKNGVQIIAPHDQGIAAMIQMHQVPMFKLKNNQILSSCIDITKSLQADYIQYLKSLIACPEPIQNAITYVNTSMHGVSDAILSRAFESIGYPLYIPVKEQQKPDPTFATVSFPNPEEKGALRMALNIANQVEASYILAQDPDADRFCAAEKLNTGIWKIFTGDQLGIIFASQAISNYLQSGNNTTKAALISSTVSSKMLSHIAKLEGLEYQECLTGFKFIGNTALKLEESGYNVIFGYEEAIGYMFGNKIRDKDGIAATLHFVKLVYDLCKQNKTVSMYLDELYEKYGYFETYNGYFKCDKSTIIEEIFYSIRHQSKSQTYPTSLGGFQIYRIIDLTTGYDSGSPPLFKPTLPLSSGHMIQIMGKQLDSSNTFFLTLRTSGTEPKIKFYLEGSGSKKADISKFLRIVVDDLAENWIQASFYSLELC
ncbi:phosphoglucomutase 1 [Crepidotus variabilis]|uniref:Phosphoglucomutase 1 n=1 Tax=Crepidotus variabilis TaxID=179855 RepID=A0A9P6JU38_9AGAR|nr:phosphoglucomutase 1 [Crepidotus variabilis]